MPRFKETRRAGHALEMLFYSHFMPIGESGGHSGYAKDMPAFAMHLSRGDF